MQSRVTRHAFILKCFDHGLHIREALDSLECLFEVLAIFDVSVDPLLECLLADLLIGEVDGGAVGRQHFAYLPEAAVAHQRTVALLVAAKRPLPGVLGHRIWRFVGVCEDIAYLFGEFLAYKRIVEQHATLLDAYIVVELVYPCSGSERLLARHHPCTFLVDFLVRLFERDEAGH
jgi:hypothetical protein